jgi:hypothetical protein
MRNWIAALALSDHMLRDIGLRRDEIALIGQQNGPRIQMDRPARRLRGAGHETDHRPYLARAHEPRQG